LDAFLIAGSVDINLSDVGISIPVIAIIGISAIAVVAIGVLIYWIFKRKKSN
jgi:hypothetical protein